MTEKKRFFGRMGQWGLKRVGLGDAKIKIKTGSDGSERVEINRSPVQLVHATLKEGARNAELKPRAWDAQGYEGRYPDGGIAAFAAMMAEKDVKESELAAIVKGWSRQAMIYSTGALMSVIAAFAIVVTEGSFMSLLLGLGMLCVATMLGGLAMSADFSAWRIRERRMGGLEAYLSQRTRMTKKQTTAPAAAQQNAGRKAGSKEL